ncbi:hypothetical protein ACFW1A_38660 [Kitasatospora sp. NPDC058965]|uniref:hypothetical protein n=1 Tax=Kitasatospora sp. NPDC058965 TaxID=3346682 RepID=UPI00369682CA
MVTQDSGPLAGAVEPGATGQRLVFVPSRAGELGSVLAVKALAPALVATPLLLLALELAHVENRASYWRLAWVLVWIAVLVVLLRSASALFVALARTVRSVEFRTEGEAPRLVITRFLHSVAVPSAELRFVKVEEQLRVGERRSIKVLLYFDLAAGPVECAPPRSIQSGWGGSTEMLLDWLTGQLGPLRIPVEYEAISQRHFECPEEWWQADRPARLWQVPKSEVAELAARYGVSRAEYLDQDGGKDRSAATITVYDPAQVYDLIERIRADRAAAAGAVDPVVEDAVESAE